MDGVLADGGMALAQSQHVVVTERASFYVGAPAVGLALQGGLSYRLARCSGVGHALGLYIGMTGVNLDGEDMVAAGTLWLALSISLLLFRSCLFK